MSSPSLFDDLEKKAECAEEKGEKSEDVERFVEYIRQGAPVIGKSPWPNYVVQASAENATYKRWKANLAQNALELSSKMVPIPLQIINEQQQKAFDEMALMDTNRVTLIPMIAHNFYMFTPALLMLFLASTPPTVFKSLRENCLKVAFMWKTAQDDETRAFYRQNLLKLQDILAAEIERYQSEKREEMKFDSRMLVTHVIVHYRRIMNMIRVTHGFAKLDEAYASEMAALIHRCDVSMTREVKALFKESSFEKVLEPVVSQIRRTGYAYNLGEIDVCAFQNALIDNTIAFVNIMERWLLRVVAPQYPEFVHFYHLSSPQMPAQTDLTRDETSAAKNIRDVSCRARETYDSYNWPEFHRCQSPFGTLAASLTWPSSVPIPQMDRTSTAESIVACALAVTRSHHKPDLTRRRLDALCLLKSEGGVSHPRELVNFTVLVPNPDCPTGDELPLVLSGNAAKIFQ